MVSNFFQTCRAVAAVSSLILFGAAAQAEPAHGISMYGTPALPPDFVSLPYANPQAPKGGAIVLGNTGGFDSLNPFVRKGTAPWQLAFFTHETLMGRSWDEPFTLYGLLAESVEVPEDRSWVEFALRPEARFSDGSPVTVEDVIFSYDMLGSEGHPRYHGLRAQIDSIVQTGPRTVRMTFNTENRELALLAGMRPILSKAQWEGRDFANAALADIPLGSGPYSVTDYQAGRQVTLTRNPDYWGKDVPFRRGTHNIDQIKLDFYGDANVLFEAFKAGEISALREFNAETWATDVDAMQANGLALGGNSGENAVVFDGDKVVSPGGLRHADEPVRHKMLDALGDLALAGAPLIGHYTGVRAGHSLTNTLLRALFATPGAVRLVECDTEMAQQLPGHGLVWDEIPAVA